MRRPRPSRRDCCCSLAALLALGWNRWPHEEREPPPALSPRRSTTTTTATVTGRHHDHSATPAITTTIALRPGDRARRRPRRAGSPHRSWSAALVAVSARGGLGRPGHGRRGRRQPDRPRRRRRPGPCTGWHRRSHESSASPWPRTGRSGPPPTPGSSPSTTAAWIRRFDAPVGGVAVGEDGTVWIGGGDRADSRPERLWLARWDMRCLGAPGRATPTPPRPPSGQAPIAVLPNGEVWIAHRAGYWVEDDLMRYDGAAMETVEIPGVPDATPDNADPRRCASSTSRPSADGRLWAVGYLAADPNQAVLARSTARTWTLYDWPSAASRATRSTGPRPGGGARRRRLVRLRRWPALLRRHDLAELPGRGGCSTTSTSPPTAPSGTATPMASTS